MSAYALIDFILDEVYASPNSFVYTVLIIRIFASAMTFHSVLEFGALWYAAQDQQQYLSVCMILETATCIDKRESQGMTQSKNKKEYAATSVGVYNIAHI